jgi:CDP-diacylglycerol--glycerol-3-phosphate 3-phosphatidyltransferase
MVQPGPIRSLWATLVFLTAALTDWLDGYLARLFRAESILGTVLDPLADKILVMSALVMLAALPDGHSIPAWMVVILLTREMLISGLRALAALNSTVVPASRTAKHKTGWTFVAIVLLLMGEPIQFGVSFHLLGMIALWVSVVLSVISGFQYAYALRRYYL